LTVNSKYLVIRNPLGSGLHQEGKRLTKQRLKVLNLFENIGPVIILAPKRFMGN